MRTTLDDVVVYIQGHRFLVARTKVNKFWFDCLIYFFFISFKPASFGYSARGDSSLTAGKEHPLAALVNIMPRLSSISVPGNQMDWSRPIWTISSQSEPVRVISLLVKPDQKFRAVKPPDWSLVQNKWMSAVFCAQSFRVALCVYLHILTRVLPFDANITILILKTKSVLLYCKSTLEFIFQCSES